MTQSEQIVSYVEKISTLVGAQSIYGSQLESIKQVSVGKCTEILTQEQIRRIKSVVKPKKHMCYENAYKVAQLLGCEYCEGYLFECLPIEHAFNKIGDKYIDVTVEFALKDDPTKIGYATIGEYDNSTIRAVACEQMVYGGVYEYLFRKKLKQ